MTNEAHRSGVVAVVGRPNVGKSTLVNALLGRKLSIVSRRAQTTRHRILGIRTAPSVQCVYVDTPGIHQAQGRALNRHLNRTAVGALAGVDLCLLVVEALRWHPDDERALARVRDAGVRMILVVNKVDRVADKTRLLPYLAEATGRGEFDEIVPVCARDGDGVDILQGLVDHRLPLGEPLYPEDQWTDCSERFLAAELLREQLLAHVGDEIPHRLAVEIDAFQESEEGVRIAATVWVERKGQKAIVIGQGGRVLKSAGIGARSALERLLGCHVRIETWVKVRQGWSADERALRGLGLSD